MFHNSEYLQETQSDIFDQSSLRSHIEVKMSHLCSFLTPCNCLYFAVSDADMQSPIKDQLRSLLKREIRFDTLQNSRLEVVSKQSSNSPISTSFTSPNITSDISTRDVAAQWLHEVVNDSKSPLDVFLLAVTLMDKFLELEPKVTKTQVQLCASACLLIASKLRIKDDHPLLTETQIVQYTDHSIDKTELKVIKAP